MPKYGHRIVENSAVILAATSSIIVICRQWITFAGPWIVTFSTPKLYLLTIFFLSIAWFLIFTDAKKWKILLVIIFSFAGIRSASFGFYGLRSDGNYDKNGHSYHYQNNPYIGSSGKLRQLIKLSSGPNDFWRRVCNEFPEICSSVESIDKRAERAMLLVSNLFYYGNSPRGEFAEKSGCVGRSSETGHDFIKPDWALYQSSRIGCCNDFAYFLSSFLNYLSIENEFVLMPGHIANRFMNSNGEWVYVDSNATIMVEGLFSGAKVDRLQFSIYPHPNVDPNLGDNARYSMYNFQRGLVSSMSDRLHFVFNYLSTENSGRADAILQGK